MMNKFFMRNPLRKINLHSFRTIFIFRRTETFFCGSGCDVYFISCLKAGRFPQLGGANLTQKIGMQRLLFMEKSFQKGFQRGIAGATFKSSNLVCLPVYIYPFALSDMKISMITPLLLILLAGVDQEKMIVQKKLKSLCSIRHCSIISFFIIL